MKAMRLSTIVVILGALVVGFVLDHEPRTFDEFAAVDRLGVPTTSSGTWFCPGGSGEGGPAVVGIEIVNAGTEPATAEVAALGSAAGDQSSTQVALPPGERVAIALPDLAPESEWVGAVIEVDSSMVIVEQSHEGPTGTDRSTCATRAGASFVVTDGATRVLSDGEEMTLLLLNPFQEDAVVDISFVADVGPDSLDAVVVPGQQLVAINVTDEVTVARRVAATLDVIAGRLSVGRVQTRESESLRGLAVTPAVVDGAEVSVLPILGTGQTIDTVTVTNAHGTEAAEVDLEILTDGSVSPDPIELTVRPGRTVRIDMSTEDRLGDLGPFSLMARSLNGIPVAVMLESSAGLATEGVPGTAAVVGIDGASETWIAPMEGGAGSLAIMNPSRTSIATVEVSVVDPEGQTVVLSLELGPGRRTTIPVVEIGEGRPIVIVQATAPVIVGRDLTGFTSRQLLAGAAVGEVIPLSRIE
jgi:hypothetical protein